MADLKVDPERVRARVDQLQAEIDRLNTEITVLRNVLDNAIDERQRGVYSLENQLKAIRERFGSPAEASNG